MSEYNKCLASAQRSLAMREHSRYQIKNKLINKGFEKKIVNDVLQELLESGFQSDKRYTEEYIRYRQNIGYGVKKIIFELKSNGISSSIISEYLNNFIDDYDVLFKLASDKILNENLNDQKILAKYINHFKYRGFDNNIILKVIKNIKNFDKYEK